MGNGHFMFPFFFFFSFLVVVIFKSNWLIHWTSSRLKHVIYSLLENCSGTSLATFFKEHKLRNSAIASHLGVSLICTLCNAGEQWWDLGWSRMMPCRSDLPRAEQRGSITSLDLVMQPKIPLGFFARRPHCCLMFYSVSTRSHRSFYPSFSLGNLQCCDLDLRLLWQLEAPSCAYWYSAYG